MVVAETPSAVFHYSESPWEETGTSGQSDAIFRAAKKDLLTLMNLDVSMALSGVVTIVQSLDPSVPAFFSFVKLSEGRQCWWLRVRALSTLSTRATTGYPRLVGETSINDLISCHLLKVANELSSSLSFTVPVRYGFKYFALFSF